MNPIPASVPSDFWIAENNDALRRHAADCLSGRKLALGLHQTLEGLHAVLVSRFLTTVIVLAALTLLPLHVIWG